MKTKQNQHLILRITSFGLVAALLTLGTGCASIVSGTHRKVAFNSNPQGANVTIVNEKGKVVAQGTTPFTASLMKGKPYFMGRKYTITFAKDGFATAEHQMKSTLNGWYLGNLVFGGLLGLIIVDPLTGAMYTLPKDVTVSLNPRTAALPGKGETQFVQLRDVPAELHNRLIPLK